MMNIKALKIKLFILCFVFLYMTNVNAASQGEKLYMQNCMICHADDGSGAMPGIFDLTENKAWSSIDEQSLLAKLKKGIQKEGTIMNMPAKGGNPNLTDKDLKEIMNYMRQTFLK